MAELIDQVERLVSETIERCARFDGGPLPTGFHDDLEAVRRRLDEPIRVAIAGRVKAGKSTLLNALVGE